MRLRGQKLKFSCAWRPPTGPEIEQQRSSRILLKLVAATIQGSDVGWGRLHITCSGAGRLSVRSICQYWRPDAKRMLGQPILDAMIDRGIYNFVARQSIRRPPGTSARFMYITQLAVIGYS